MEFLDKNMKKPERAQESEQVVSVSPAPVTTAVRPAVEGSCPLIVREPSKILDVEPE